MGRLILFDLVSLDGFFEAPGHDISWHSVDDEFDRLAIEQLDAAGCLVFGRVTYELMASFWPSEQGMREDPEVARRMNALPKVVFSRTLRSAGWENTRLAGGDAAAEMAALKGAVEKEIYLFGSADLAATFTAAGLIDEYRVIVNPIVLGAGTPLFKPGRRLDLRLIESRAYENGNVLLRYEPAG